MYKWNQTFRGILKVRFFSFFSVPRSTVFWSFEVEFSELVVKSSGLGTSPASAVLVDSASAVMFTGAEALSRVWFFLGTSTHSEISTTTSARSKESMPLLLREKWRLALIGDERLRDMYLKNWRIWNLNSNIILRIG